MCLKGFEPSAPGVGELRQDGIDWRWNANFVSSAHLPPKQEKAFQFSKIFSECCVLRMEDSWSPFDHYGAVTPQNTGKACCDDQQQAFSCFDGKCAEPTKFTFQRQSILPCRSSPTAATWQVLGSFLFDTARFALTKTQWSAVVRPRIDHYWKLTTLQDWNTL